MRTKQGLSRVQPSAGAIRHLRTFYALPGSLTAHESAALSYVPSASMPLDEIHDCCMITMKSRTFVPSLCGYGAVNVSRCGEKSISWVTHTGDAGFAADRGA